MRFEKQLTFPYVEQKEYVIIELDPGLLKIHFLYVMHLSASRITELFDRKFTILASTVFPFAG